MIPIVLMAIAGGFGGFYLAIGYFQITGLTDSSYASLLPLFQYLGAVVGLIFGGLMGSSVAHFLSRFVPDKSKTWKKASSLVLAGLPYAGARLFCIVTQSPQKGRRYIYFLFSKGILETRSIESAELIEKKGAMGELVGFHQKITGWWKFLVLDESKRFELHVPQDGIAWDSPK